MKKIAFLIISFLLFGFWAANAQTSEFRKTSQSGEKFLYVLENVQKEKNNWVVKVAVVGGDVFPVVSQDEFQKLANVLAEKVFSGTTVTFSMPTQSLLKVTFKESQAPQWSWKQLFQVLSENLHCQFVSVIEPTFHIRQYYQNYYYRGPWFIYNLGFPQNSGILVAEYKSWQQDFEVKISQTLPQNGKSSLTVTVRTRGKDGILDGVVQEISISKIDGKVSLEKVRWYFPEFDEPPSVVRTNFWGRDLQKYAGDLPASIQTYLTPEVLAAIASAASSEKEK